MKKLPFAAAALLLGTSAYAMIPSTQPAGGVVHADADMVAPPLLDPVYDEAPALQPAAIETWSTAEPVAYTADDNAAGLKTVTGTSDDVKAADKADAELVADEDDADWAAAAQAKLDAAAPAETVTEAMETAAADPTPQPAAQNYPACSPGRGDDRCIQLYEPGVQRQLASWTQPSGGFAGSGDTQVAMGGPHEPVDSATETERLNQQALVESAASVQMAEAAQADETGTRVAMGGPYEPVADDAAMNGDGTVDTALGETAGDEEVSEA